MLNITDKTKNYVVFLFIFLFMYILNCLTPTFFGDDILYTYKWEGDMHLLKPVTFDNVLISSFSDLFTSIKTHYLNWHGRLVPVFLMFFWGWIGKNWFNIFNALMFVLLIYFMGNVISYSDLKECNWKEYFFLFCSCWIFLPGWSDIFLWQSGSVNYLWTIVLILYFFSYYLQIDSSDFNIFKLFFIGLLSGCTNENNVPVVILGCLFLTYKSIKRPFWSFAGIFGLIFGLFLVLKSPSIKNRIIYDSVSKIPFLNTEYAEALKRVIDGVNNGQMLPWLSEKIIVVDNFISVFLYFIFVLPFFVFLFINWKSLKEKNIKIFTVMSVVSMLCMMFSLFTPFRSLYFSFIYLLISVLLLYRKIYMERWLKILTKMFVLISILYFGITSSLYIYGKYLSWNDYLLFDNYLKNHEGQSVVYKVPYYPSLLNYLNKPVAFYNDGFCFEWIKKSVVVKYKLKDLNLIF